MSSLLSELLTPELMMAIYLFIAFIVALYVLSVVYVFVDARRRGIQAFWAWGIVSLIPFIGLIAYLALRPHSYLADREEQELDMALRERQLSHYGTCPNCGSALPHISPERRLSRRLSLSGPAGPGQAPQIARRRLGGAGRFSVLPCRVPLRFPPPEERFP